LISRLVLVFVALLAAPAFAQTAPNAARGKIVFLECQGCHAAAPGGPALIGPSLAGIYGRKAASLPGYDYSAALKASGIIWTSEKLDPWLANPAALVPGTKMAFTGIADPSLRADVIEYLKTLK
jgi:cytochrome c